MSAEDVTVINGTTVNRQQHATINSVTTATTSSSSGSGIVTRDIKINVGYSVTIAITVSPNNGFLFTMTEAVNTNEAVDITQLLTGVSTTAATLYVSCLRGKEVVIMDRPTLLDCCKIYSLTEDKVFLAAIIKQLFLLWSILSPALYSASALQQQQQLDSDVARDIWLHCPHQLLPELYTSNSHFMTEWLARDDNKTVTINGTEVFTYQVKTESQLEEYRQRQLNVYYKRSDGIALLHAAAASKPLFENSTFLIDGEKVLAYSNVFAYWLSGGNRKCFTLAGDKQGPQLFYPSGTLTRANYYLDGRQVGDDIRYYESGRINCVTTEVGVNTLNFCYYLDDEQHTLERLEKQVNGLAVEVELYISKNPFARTNGYTEKLNYGISAASEIIDGLTGVYSYLDTITFLDQTSKTNKTSKIMRSITGLKHRCDRVDTSYDGAGQVIQAQVYSSVWHYDMKKDLWFVLEQNTDDHE